MDETDGNHGPTCRLIEWFRPLSPCPPQAGCWYSRLERRPYVRLIVLGNGPRHAIGLGPRIPKQPSEFDTCPNEYALDPKLELRPLPSPGVTRLQRYYKPLRHPTVPSLSLTGVWLVIPDRALGLPVLRALSLCTCCRQYPGAATGRRLRSSHLAVSAFPEIAVGSACTSSFSRLARRSLALRPAHSRRHLYVTR